MQTRFITYYDGSKHKKRVEKSLDERMEATRRRYYTIHLSENVSKLTEAEETVYQIYREIDQTVRDMNMDCFFRELKPGT